MTQNISPERVSSFQRLREHGMRWIRTKRCWLARCGWLSTKGDLRAAHAHLDTCATCRTPGRRV